MNIHFYRFGGVKMRKRNIALIMSLLIITNVFTGCSSDSGDGNSQVKEIDEMAAVQTEKVQLSIYYPNLEKNMLQREIRDIEKEEALKSVNNLTQVVINEVLSGPSSSDGLQNIFPNTISLLEEAVIDASTGVAKINFDADFTNAFETANAEKLAIAALVNSLTEIKEISGLQILVEGKTVDKMKNGTSIKEVIKRDISLIMSNGEQTQAAPSSVPSSAPSSAEEQVMAEEYYVDDELNLD